MYVCVCMYNVCTMYAHIMYFTTYVCVCMYVHCKHNSAAMSYMLYHVSIKFIDELSSSKANCHIRKKQSIATIE